MSGAADVAASGFLDVRSHAATAGDQFFFIIPSSFFIPSFDM